MRWAEQRAKKGVQSNAVHMQIAQALGVCGIVGEGAWRSCTSLNMQDGLGKRPKCSGRGHFFSYEGAARMAQRAQETSLVAQKPSRILGRADFVLSGMGLLYVTCVRWIEKKTRKI